MEGEGRENASFDRGDYTRSNHGTTPGESALQPLRMFVQSEKFAEAHGGKKTDVSIFGQESNPATLRLAHMNLAIHGIEANLSAAPGDTFVRDAHPDLKAHFIWSAISDE